MCIAHKHLKCTPIILPSVTIKMSCNALHPVRIYRHSLLSYNGSGNWTDAIPSWDTTPDIVDSHPRFRYSIRFEQVGLSETARSCYQTDWIGNEISVEQQLRITGQERSI